MCVFPLKYADTALSPVQAPLLTVHSRAEVSVSAFSFAVNVCLCMCVSEMSTSIYRCGPVKRTTGKAVFFKISFKFTLESTSLVKCLHEYHLTCAFLHLSVCHGISRNNS